MEDKARNAFIFSFLIYGTGQIYLGATKRGAAILVSGLSLTFAAVYWLGWLGSVFAIAFWVWQLYDVYKLIQKFNIQNKVAIASETSTDIPDNEKMFESQKESPFMAEPKGFTLRVSIFLIITVFFFAGTLLASFFGIIVMINYYNLKDIGPGLFMVGLVPPSIASILLFTKVFGRFLK